MKAKIEWYREVLELEPGSKVLFPLAHLLGEAGEADEAVRVLRQGLARPPEYIEARLLLVQLLQKFGDSAQCAEELSEITDVFEKYPGFWEAWSEHCATDDAACALSFLAAVFRSPGLSLREMFAAALSGVGTKPSRRAAAHKGRHAGQEAPAPDSASDFAPPDLPDSPDPHGEAAPVSSAHDLQPPLAPVVPVVQEDEDHDEPSLRTRTMAEILAEQGDVRGAADIYTEILANTAPGEEADKLRERLAALTSRLADRSADEAEPGAETGAAASAADPEVTVLDEAAFSELDAVLDGPPAGAGEAAPGAVPPDSLDPPDLAVTPETLPETLPETGAETLPETGAETLPETSPEPGVEMGGETEAALNAPPAMPDAPPASGAETETLAAAPDAVPPAPAGENPMRDMLEKLAQRLDARAAQ
jgi:tetratricopeptide (TPR) repeat protein